MAAVPSTSPPHPLPIPNEFAVAAALFEKSVAAADSAAINDQFDMRTLLERCSDGVPAPKGFRDGFIIGATKTTPAQMLYALLQKGVSYRLLHLINENGTIYALFRLIGPTGAINYQKWELAKANDGKIRIVDGYNAIAGENFTDTFRRMYVAAAAQAQPSLFDKITGADRSYLDHFSDIQAISQNIQANHPAQALAIFARLPDALKQEKTFALMQLQCLHRLLPARKNDYQTALEAYGKRFAGDPSVDLVCLDERVNSKDFAAAYLSLDRLDAWTGGDPYLASMRASMILMEDKPGAAINAEKIVRQAINDEGRLLLPRLILLQALCTQNKFDDATDVLRDYEKRTGKPLQLESLPDLKPFAESAPYKKYRSSQ